MTRSPIALAALATLAVPGLDVVATRPPVRTTADYQTAGLLDARGRHWVVRVPRTPAAGAGMEGEVALLERLVEKVDARALPFEVERPAGFTTLTEGGRAMVCRQLPGRPGSPEDLDADPDLARSLGTALAALHGLDHDLVGDAGLPVYDIATYRRRRLGEVDDAARTGDIPPELLNRWEQALEDDSLWPEAARVVHGDLDADLVRVGDGQVTALMHFGESHVGDPAEDFAWLVSSVEPETLDHVLDAYLPGDPHLLDRAQLMSELLLVRWLMFGRRAEDEAVVTDARHMLLDLATDLAASPPIGSATRGAAHASGPSSHAGDDADEVDDPWDEADDTWPETEGDDQTGAGSGVGGAPTDLDEDANLLADEAELDDEAWPAYDAHPGETPGMGEPPTVPEPTAATADLSEEYEAWRREGREL